MTAGEALGRQGAWNHAVAAGQAGASGPLRYARGMSFRSLEYSVLDVFAENALEGNPLAVFHDGRGLSTDDMQALARETNLSETTFVLRADDAERERREGVHVRIFTTLEELPFAGHPTLGTASWLWNHYAPVQGAETVILRLKGGDIPVRFPGQREGASAEAGVPRSVFGSMRQKDPEFGEECTPAEVAAVLGLAEDDLLPGFRPQAVSTGNTFCIVPLRDVAALGRLAIPQTAAVPWLRTRGIRWFYCVAPHEPEAAEPVWRARMQWLAGEDPATGSAAGPCIAWLVEQGLVKPGQQAILEQGVEMRRPSRLFVRASRDGNRVHGIEVAGRTVPVADGRYFLSVR